MAEAIGIKGISIRKPDELPSAIAAALAHNGPVVLDVYSNPSELAMPPKIDLGQAKGFGLYMLHETFDGQISEVIDTIKTNFLT
jgi:pyruvate dehydrogenase (quinone)